MKKTTAVFRRGLIAAALLPAVALTGCKTTTVIDQHRELADSVLGAGEAVVVLGRRHSARHETEAEFIDCVGQSLGRGRNGIRVIPERTFVDAMYPYFETSTAPMDVKNLDKLMRNAAIADKFDEFNIRYFIWIDGSTETTDKSGSVSCAVGPGGGGCFGFAYWSDEASYEASIWDFKALSLSGKINAETRGTSFLPAVIVPIPILARVQSNSCKSLSNQIRSFIAPTG